MSLTLLDEIVIYSCFLLMALLAIGAVIYARVLRGRCRKLNDKIKELEGR